MPRLLSEYFAARAQSAGRNCPNAVGEMAMRKETATTASALIVWKTTVALVIGSGLEDNKRFTNVKGYASQVLAKTSRFRGLQRRERLFSARLVGYPEFAAPNQLGDAGAVSSPTPGGTADSFDSGRASAAPATAACDRALIGRYRFRNSSTFGNSSRARRPK